MKDLIIVDRAKFIRGLERKYRFYHSKQTQAYEFGIIQGMKLANRILTAATIIPASGPVTGPNIQ